jgi:glycosyltransferase involved in cell wall biosynthesis
MRVGVVSHTYVVPANRGKLEAVARKAGVELLLLVPRRWTNRDLGHVVWAAPTAGAFRTVPLGAWASPVAALLVYSPLALWRELRRFGPDVVHLEEEPWSVAALEVALLCGHIRVPFTFFTWENIDRALPPSLAWIRRSVLARAAAAVAGSTEAGRLLAVHGFRRPIAVLPQLGVDPKRFAPAQAPAECVIGFVGRLVPEKGVFVLLEAAARVSPAVRLLVVGNGPAKGALLARARALGLDGRFELRDEVRHDEVPAQLQRMSLLVLPSLTTPAWKEQFGHVLIEAMACGVPVVGSDSGAIPEVIGDAGVVVKEGDPGALAAALDDLLRNATRRADLIARGRSRVLAHYSDDSVARRLAAVWQGVLAGAS